MALAIVQSGDTGVSPVNSGTPAQVLPGVVTVGNCVAVAIITSSSVASVTAEMGAFVRVNQHTMPLTEMEWWVCLDATGNNYAIYVTTAGSQQWSAAGFEVSGGVGTATTGGTASGSSTAPALTIANTVGNVVLVGANGEGTITPPSSPWTGTVMSGTLNTVATAYQVTTSSSVTATFALSPTGSWRTLGLILGVAIPGAPTLEVPFNAGSVDVTGGVEFAATYNAALSHNQNAYAMRIKVSGGSYNYWNAGTSALQSGIVWNSDSVAPGASFGPTFPNGIISNGNVYNWSMASQDAVSGAQGAFASDFTFTAEVGPTVTVIAPTGTVGGTTQPTVVWTPTFGGSDSQVTYQIIVESGSYGTVPGSGVVGWSSGVITSPEPSVVIGTALTPGTTYRVFVQITETGGGTSTWGYSTFTLVVDVPATPIITAVADTDVNGVPIVVVTVQGLDNYLDYDDASFEGSGSGSVGSWVAGSNTTVSAVNEGLDGDWALNFHPATAGTMVAASGKYPVTVGVSYFFIGSAFAIGGTAVLCAFLAKWYNGASLLSTSTIQSTGDSTSGWTTYTGYATAPASATDVELQMAFGTGNEDHAIDCMGFFPVAATEWGQGGFVGSTAAILTRSDGVYVRYASQSNPLPLPSGTQFATVYDYEVTPTVAYTYSGVVEDVSTPLTSAPDVSASVTVETTGWWELNPTSGDATSNPSATNAQMINWSPVQTEQSTANPVINQTTMNIAANIMMQQDFTATAELFSAAIYAAFNALLIGQQTVFISSPFGVHDSGYFRIGPASGSQSGGSGTTAKTTTLLSGSTASAPHRTVAISAVAQPEPPV